MFALNRDRPPDGLTWRGYLIQLLHIASSIEHSLMVQYLYAAYSLGGKQVTKQSDQEMVSGWQDLMLSVAKEEMGHLLTVQNVLCLLGASVELARENHPWDSDFYPFRFRLERLSMASLSRYIWAEMPEDPDLLLWGLGVSQGHADPQTPNLPGAHHVSKLYREIIRIIGNVEHIPDSDFHDDSIRFQASWDDWGRGHNYKPELEAKVTLVPGDVGLSLNHPGWEDTRDLFVQNFLDKVEKYKDEPTRADVIIERVRTRSQAKDALAKISEQGEAAGSASGSHFARFSAIKKDFQEAKQKNGKNWEPTHKVVADPHTRLPNEKRRESASTILWPLSEKWANLFNLRYRMLLTYLSQSYQLARDGSQGRLRGGVIHKVFGEMYNLKTIAGILVRLPLRNPADPRRAGPPFQMPYTLVLPLDAINRWQLHRDLIDGTLELIADLRSFGSGVPEELALLKAMQDLDEKTGEWIEHVIAGLTRAGARSR